MRIFNYCNNFNLKNLNYETVTMRIIKLQFTDIIFANRKEGNVEIVEWEMNDQVKSRRRTYSACVVLVFRALFVIFVDYKDC